jgi:hypothetical protein
MKNGSHEDLHARGATNRSRFIYTSRTSFWVKRRHKGSLSIILDVLFFLALANSHKMIELVARAISFSQLFIIERSVSPNEEHERDKGDE